VFTVSLEDPINEVSLVEAAIFPFKATLALFLALVKGANILSGVIVPAFLALAMLGVIDPTSNIFRSIGVYIGTLTVGHIILPFSLVDVSIGMGHATFAVHLAIFKHTLVFGTIRPELNT
jgi:hypothetical protein